MNREYATKMITRLLQWGVEEFYVCAGARDIPLIEVITNIQSEKKIVFNHFEERSAAFYAAGRIKSLLKPVAVVTTSGTAVAELFPAVMECYYNGLPLVLITADRPQSYRGSGAPQSVEQKNIFGNYVSHCFDLTVQDEFFCDEIPKNKPVHINICFDVPLQSGTLHPISKSDICSSFELMNTFPEVDFLHHQNILNDFLSQDKNIIVIVSQVLETEKSTLITFLKKLKRPVYFESLSNLRECPELNEFKINCGDKIWSNAEKSGYHIDAVLKIGRTPTHRFWRDLDEIKKNIPVLSISEVPFPGIPNAVNIQTNFRHFFSKIQIHSKEADAFCLNTFIKHDHQDYDKLIQLFQKYPKSEQSFFYQLSQKIAPSSRVYLGNSLPIRYWDLAATYENKNFQMDASRGVNGIDGQISSFLGFAQEGFNNYGIFGDLTTLYDMAGFWMLRHHQNMNASFLIINNKGGKIFNKVLKGDVSLICQNTHELDFQHLARLWNISYEKFTDLESSKITCDCQKLIEICPDDVETELFSRDYFKI